VISNKTVGPSRRKSEDFFENMNRKTNFKLTTVFPGSESKEKKGESSSQAKPSRQVKSHTCDNGRRASHANLPSSPQQNKPERAVKKTKNSFSTLDHCGKPQVSPHSFLTAMTKEFPFCSFLIVSQVNA
jgi:hypothetical protein